MPLLNQDREPTPAELFEDFFGPAIFTPWTRVLLEYARPRRGERVLDLACATGIVARRVAPLVAPDGSVTGVDISPAMLAVARDRAAREGLSIEWREGDATRLDLPDDEFDLVVCQQGLQFFPDPLASLREMARVLSPGGRVVLSVWQPLEHQPVYRALFEAEARHLGVELREVAVPFGFEGADRLRALLVEAGFERVAIDERTLDAVFHDPDTFVALTVIAAASVMPEVAQDDPQRRSDLIAAITRDSDETVRRHIEGDTLRYPMPNLVATAAVPG